jgi:hypothetical protein
MRVGGKENSRFSAEAQWGSREQSRQQAKITVFKNNCAIKTKMLEGLNSKSE